jgi:hypothetical protein
MVSTVVAGVVLVALHAINLAQTSDAGTELMLVVLLAVPPVGSGARTTAPDCTVSTVVAGVVLFAAQAINLAQTSDAGTELMLVVLLAVPPVGSGA